MSSPVILLWSDSCFYSPYAMSVYVALKEKGLPFSLKCVDLASGEQQQQAYGEVSLTQRVPTLELDNFYLSESSAITEYLEEHFPAPQYRPLYPGDGKKRAKAREMQAWLRSDLIALRQQRPTEVLFAGKRYAPLDAAAQQAANKLISAATHLLSPGQQNLFGEWSIADTELALMLNRLAHHGDPLSPPLAQYAERQWQRESVKQWIAEQEKPAA